MAKLNKHQMKMADRVAHTARWLWQQDWAKDGLTPKQNEAMVDQVYDYVINTWPSVGQDEAGMIADLAISMPRPTVMVVEQTLLADLEAVRQMVDDLAWSANINVDGILERIDALRKRLS